MASPDQARAEAELSLLYSWGPDVYQIVYNLVRRDGQWLVIEESLPGVWLLRLGKEEKPYWSLPGPIWCQILFCEFAYSNSNRPCPRWFAI